MGKEHHHLLLHLKHPLFPAVIYVAFLPEKLLATQHFCETALHPGEQLALSHAIVNAHIYFPAFVRRFGKLVAQ